MGFETLLFPEGLAPSQPAGEYADQPRVVAIAAAARRLNELREAWLNPPDLVERVPEVVPDFPDRIVPVSAKAAAILKKRKLTNLYNERPAWIEIEPERALPHRRPEAYRLDFSKRLGKYSDFRTYPQCKPLVLLTADSEFRISCPASKPIAQLLLKC